MIKQYLKPLLILMTILLLAGLGVAYYVFLNTKEDKTSIANQSLTAAPEMPYIDMNGEVVDLTQYTNQIRVVNSWASWSPLSKDELPALNDIAKDYNEKGIVFLAINRMENRDYALGYLMTLPELNNLKIVFDAADNYFSKVEGYAMPETIVFDKAGNIKAHYRGLIRADELKSTLDTLINESN